MVVKKVFEVQESLIKPSSNFFLCIYSVIDVLLAVLLFTILFYPYFVCLTTEYKFVGSILGFLYGVLRCVYVYVSISFNYGTFYISSLSQT